MFKSFLQKFNKHFALTPKADIIPFLNTYESLLDYHIKKEEKKEGRVIITTELKQEFSLYVLKRIFSSTNSNNKKILSCPLLDTVLSMDFKSISDIKKCLQVTITLNKNDAMTDTC